jgi:hypothetical protein
MQKLLLRRTEARKMLGLGEFAFKSLVDSKRIVPIYPVSGGLAYFKTIDILKLGGLKNEADIKKMV